MTFRDSPRPGLDVRLRPLAAHVLAWEFYECAWQLFRYGQFKGLTDLEAGAELGAWCKRQGITATFEIRKFRGADVLYLLLTSRAS